MFKEIQTKGKREQRSFEKYKNEGMDKRNVLEMKSREKSRDRLERSSTEDVGEKKGERMDRTKIPKKKSTKNSKQC